MEKTAIYPRIFFGYEFEGDYCMTVRLYCTEDITKALKTANPMAWVRHSLGNGELCSILF